MDSPQDPGAPATKADILLIVAAVERLSVHVSRQDQRFDDLSARVDSLSERVDRIAQDLQDFKVEVSSQIERLAQDLQDFKVEVNTRFQEFEHRMEQFVLDAEGRIITSNYRLADSIQQRLNHNESGQAALVGRLATVEARLLEIEKRLNLPPAA